MPLMLQSLASLPSQHNSNQSTFAYRKIMASALLCGATLASAQSNAATLTLGEARYTNTDEPNSGRKSVAISVTTAFNDNSPSWSNLTACTISGTVNVYVPVASNSAQATAEIDYILQKQTFSIRAEPYAVGEGQIQIDPGSDQILFEILDDGDETEANEEINFNITSYGVTCDDESSRSITAVRSYGTIVINDPFDVKDGSQPPRAAAIPVRQKSLSSQLNSLRTLSLHSAATRDRSIAKEIDRARNNLGSSAQNLQVQLKGQNVPVGALLGSGAGDALDEFGRWGFFVTGSVDLGEEKDTEDQSDFRSSMLITGLDYQFSENFVLGAALTYTDVAAGSDETANTDFNRNSLSVFGSLYSGDLFYLDAILTYGSSGYDLDRKIARDDGGSDVGAADTDGDETSASLGAGYNFHSRNINTRIFSFVNYIDANIDGYRETVYGSSSAAVVDGLDMQSLTASIGVELSWNINSSAGVFTPLFSVAQEHQFADDAVDITGNFVGGPDDGAFYYQAPDRDDDYLSAQVGLNAVFKNGVSAFLTYDTFLDRKDLASNHFSLGARWQF